MTELTNIEELTEKPLKDGSRKTIKLDELWIEFMEKKLKNMGDYGKKYIKTVSPTTRRPLARRKG
jgi:hypothetical protein